MASEATVQLPKPLGELEGYYLRPDGAGVGESVVPLPAAWPDQREHYTEKGFHLISVVKGQGRKMVAEPPSIAEVRQLADELEGRRDEAIETLREYLDEARSMTKDADVDHSERSMHRRRVKALTAAIEALARPIDRKALYQFFIQQRRMQIIARVPKDFQTAMALQAEEQTLQERAEDWEDELAPDS